MRQFHFLAAVVLASALHGCSPAADEPRAAAPAASAATAVSPPAAPPAAAIARPDAVAPGVIGLEGLGDLRIGLPPPDGGRWAERGAQTSEACRTVSSPDYPGIYAIVADGKVQRITVGQRSGIKLAEGVGVGAAEAEVRKWFAGFREEPHTYEGAPAKYLTAPNAASGDPALRLEIGQDGKVKLIHVGTMPALGYVEGCA